MSSQNDTEIASLLVKIFIYVQFVLVIDNVIVMLVKVWLSVHGFMWFQTLVEDWMCVDFSHFFVLGWPYAVYRLLKSSDWIASVCVFRGGVGRGGG